MPRPRTVYRGKRKFSWIITLIAMILVAAILFSVWLFYSLQKYIVYDKDGLHLDLSSRRGAASETSEPDAADVVIANQHMDTEIVVEQKDYSAVETGAGADLQPIHAVFVSGSKLNDAALSFYKTGMGDFDTLVLELKTPDGFLRYASTQTLADSYAVNGTLELKTKVEELKAAGIYLVAQISALADNTMARRNSPIAMKNAASAEVFSDEDGMAYLDPYSDTVRSYLLGIITELAEMGFDEILLDGFVCPDSELLRFNKVMTQTPAPADALNSLAFWLREQADTLGIRLSVVLNRDALSGETVLMGQSPAAFANAFDRFAVKTDSVSVSGDQTALGRILGSTARAALIGEGFTPAASCYIVK